jgi:hypothetical protein
MFRLLEPAPIEIDELESKASFQYPGEILYYPPLRELAFCYGNARFRGTAHAVYVTPVGEVEGDLAPLVERGKKLQWDGATPIDFRRAPADGLAPPPASTGRRLEIRLDDVVVTATLLENLAPRTCEAFLALLPLEGPATNTAWSGAMTRFWGPLGEEGKLGLEIKPPEAPTQYHWPGYLYYHIGWDGLRICYGDGQQSGAFSASHMTPIAKLDGDWSAYRQRAGNLYLTGARPMTVRLLD